uniref:Uncharacterized protein n=1 Tax=Cacopsylla melanoneura TaxID=428564 RepID=A0A8D8RJE6_9HEMI
MTSELDMFCRASKLSCCICGDFIRAALDLVGPRSYFFQYFCFYENIVQLNYQKLQQVVTRPIHKSGLRCTSYVTLTSDTFQRCEFNVIFIGPFCIATITNTESSQLLTSFS